MTSTSSPATAHGSSTSLPAKLLNMFASPGEVFDEVLASPTRLRNWLVPTLLICLASLLVFASTPIRDQASDPIDQFLRYGKPLSTMQSEALSARWLAISLVATVAAAFAGSLWSAWVLWFIGRCFLRSRFSFLRAIEFVGLAGMILVLGTIITGLLIMATGYAGARPALSFFVGSMSPNHPVFLLLDTFNLFHLWTTCVLALGLSRLTNVSFKEAAFWVFGYWFVVRVGAILLA